MGDEISWLFEARVKPGRRAELEETIDERYADSEAALAHLRAFEENWQERLLSMIEPIRTTVRGEPSEELRAELGAGTRFHRALGGFAR